MCAYIHLTSDHSAQGLLRAEAPADCSVCEAAPVASAEPWHTEQKGRKEGRGSWWDLSLFPEEVGSHRDSAAHLEGSCPRRSLGRHGYTVEMGFPGAMQSMAVRAVPALPGGEGRAAMRTKWTSPSCSRLPAGKGPQRQGLCLFNEGGKVHLW